MSTQRRQPAGVPVGGQFAVGAHTEAQGVHLASDDVEVTQPPTQPCYDIPSARLHDATAKIDAANKKLERAGIDNRFTTGPARKPGPSGPGGIASSRRLSVVWSDRVSGVPVPHIGGV